MSSSAQHAILGMKAEHSTLPFPSLVFISLSDTCSILSFLLSFLPVFSLSCLPSFVVPNRFHSYRGVLCVLRSNEYFYSFLKNGKRNDWQHNTFSWLECSLLVDPCSDNNHIPHPSSVQSIPFNLPLQVSGTFFKACSLILFLYAILSFTNNELAVSWAGLFSFGLSRSSWIPMSICLIVIAGRQPCCSFKILKQIVPDGYSCIKICDCIIIDKMR